MDLSQLINQHKNKIFNVVVIVIALIIANNINKKQDKDIAALKEKQAIETKKNAVLNNINKQEVRMDTYKRFIPKKEASLLMNNISGMAKGSRVKIISIRPDNEQKYQEYLIRMPFDLMIAVPNYHTLGKFISELENSQDFYVVDSLDIRYERNSKELTVNLKVSSIAFENTP